MIQLAPQLKILLAVEPVDFRKGIDSLAALCTSQLDADPFSSIIFVFRGRGARPHNSTGKPCHHW
jgi:transposase